MSIWDVTASNSSGGGGEAPPAGNHPAVLVALVDLGTHEDEYQGERSENRKVFLAWELTAEHKSDGSPYVVGQEFNFMATIGQKSKLRGLLESWRGRPLGDGECLNLAALLGKPCLINVGNEQSKKGNTYAKILGVGPPPRGMTVPAPLNEPFQWHFSSGPFRAPDWLPYLYGQKVEDKILAARESRGYVAPAPAANGSAVTVPADEDSVPF